MNEPTEQVRTSLSLYPKHIRFLEDINENTSLAARTVFDSVMRTEKKNHVREKINEVMMYVIVGMLFFILAFLLDGFVVAIPTVIGAGVLTYGLISAIYLPRGKHGTVRRTR